MHLLALGLMTWVARKFRAVHRVDLMDGRHVIFYFWMFLGGSMVCLLYTAPAARKLAANRTAKVLFGTSAVLILLFVFLGSSHMISQFWRPLLPDLSKDLVLNGWRFPGTWFYLFSLTVVQRHSFSGFVGKSVAAVLAFAASGFAQLQPLSVSYANYVTVAPLWFQT